MWLLQDYLHYDIFLRSRSLHSEDRSRLLLALLAKIDTLRMLFRSR
jgi:hypothetical protein